MIARHTYAKVALPATVDVTPPEPLVITKAATTVDDDPSHLFLAMSRAALMSGASVRSGSESLKNGC